jgi:hypothetical protein
MPQAQGTFICNSDRSNNFPFLRRKTSVARLAGGMALGFAMRVNHPCF